MGRPNRASTRGACAAGPVGSRAAKKEPRAAVTVENPVVRRRERDLCVHGTPAYAALALRFRSPAGDFGPVRRHPRCPWGGGCRGSRGCTKRMVCSPRPGPRANTGHGTPPPAARRWRLALLKPSKAPGPTTRSGARSPGESRLHAAKSRAHDAAPTRHGREPQRHATVVVDGANDVIAEGQRHVRGRQRHSVERRVPRVIRCVRLACARAGRGFGRSGVGPGRVGAHAVAALGLRATHGDQLEPVRPGLERAHDLGRDPDHVP